MGGTSLEDRAAAEALERAANELNPAHSETRAKERLSQRVSDSMQTGTASGTGAGASGGSSAKSGRQNSTSASPASASSASSATLTPDMQVARMRSTSPARRKQGIGGRASLGEAPSEDFIERKEAPPRQLCAEFADQSAAVTALASGASLQQLLLPGASPERRANPNALALAAGGSSLSTRPSIIRDRYAHYRRSPGPGGVAAATASTPLASPTAAESDSPPSPSSSTPYQSALSSPDVDEEESARAAAAGPNQCVASVLVHCAMSSQSSSAGRLGRQLAFDHSSSTTTIPHNARDSVKPAVL